MAEAVSPGTVALAPSLFKKRAAKSSVRKRPETPPPATDSESSGYTSSEDELGHRVKRRRKNAGVTVTSAANAQPQSIANIDSSIKYSAERSSTINSSNDATKTSALYQDTSNERDNFSAKDLLSRTYLKSQSSATNEPTYHGAAAYTSFISKNPNAPARAPVGPIKAPTNIRTITVTDYAPDVCKDYKQTGFCGFGDNCKFLHSRESYKQGWELDREWDVLGKDKKKGGTKITKSGDDDDEEAADEEMLENIPFACIICKDPYKNPIVTKCGHYFCEGCALNRYRRNPSCAACGAGTGGVFNGAKNLKKLLERKRERAKKRREKAREEGEEVSSAEEGEDS